MLCFRNIRRRIFKAAMLSAEPSIEELRKAKNEVQIIVIGAGLAGLSAASHLIKNGFNRTLILEATDRYGGRVNSKRFGDAFCELGAKWITIDETQHSMHELLQKSAGINRRLREKEEVSYVNTVGNRLSRRVPERVDRIFRKLCEGIELEERLRTGNAHDLNNVHAYFEAQASKLLSAQFKEEERRIACDVFTALTKEFSSLLGCCLELVNIKHIMRLPHPAKDPSPIYIPTGMDNLLGHLVEDVHKNNMMIGQPVGEIKWYTDTRLDPKQVGCLDGSVFIADHIICTLPLGVLKNLATFMFRPPLPRDKLKAINSLGFGNPVRIYIEYGDRIASWFKDNAVRPLWSRAERKRDLKWTKQVVEISKVPSSNRVLEILVGGAFYEEIEKLPEEEVLRELTILLRQCLQNQQIPYPKAMLRSNWSSQACYFGGRPYFGVDSKLSDVTTLAAPLGRPEIPTLLFAGDATIIDGFGTIGGARQSGLREAQRIIDFYERLYK